MTPPFAPDDLPAQLSACSSTQQKVRVTIAAFGGYWRPLAAVARLLEELGELGEELRAPREAAGSRGRAAEPAAEPAAETAAEPAAEIATEPTSEVAPETSSEIASEIADLWIITTALADQYLATVPEPCPDRRQPACPAHLAFTRLVAAAGLIARIVNHYDGPKTPRSLQGWVSIERAVEGFHRSLAQVAADHDVDLRAAVDAKLAEIPRLDSGRFSLTYEDPATAPCLDTFRRLPTTATGALATGPLTTGPLAAGPLTTARLWGAPDWRERSSALYAAAIAPSLVSFTKVAEPERLDAYVIPGPAASAGPADSLDPPASSPHADRDWLPRLLGDLEAHEPQLSRLALRFDVSVLSFDVSVLRREAGGERHDRDEAGELACLKTVGA